LNDRIFLQISGKKQISAQPVINGTTVGCRVNVQTPTTFTSTEFTMGIYGSKQGLFY
jgi:hypothetical protein